MTRHTTPRKRLTAKQRVLKKYPYAELVRDGWTPLLGFFDCGIFKDGIDGQGIGQGDTPRQAWADAARKL